MAEKIHKSIFRLDFPLAYRILDNLGKYLELIINKTTQEPFSEGVGNVDLFHHSLNCTGKTEGAMETLVGSIPSLIKELQLVREAIARHEMS